MGLSFGLSKMASERTCRAWKLVGAGLMQQWIEIVFLMVLCVSFVACVAPVETSLAYIARDSAA